MTDKLLAPNSYGAKEATEADVLAVENALGMGCGGWDTVDPKQILEAAWESQDLEGSFYRLLKAAFPDARPIDRYGAYITVRANGVIEVGCNGEWRTFPSATNNRSE